MTCCTRLPDMAGIGVRGGRNGRQNDSTSRCCHFRQPVTLDPSGSPSRSSRSAIQRSHWSHSRKPRMMNRLSYVVMGTGLNVCQTKEDFPPALREIAVSLESASGLKIDRMSFFADLLYCLEQDYQKSRQEGFDFLLTEWADRNPLLNADVSFKSCGQTVRGRVKGFYPDGELVLIRPDGRQESYRSDEVCEVRHADCD